MSARTPERSTPERILQRIEWQVIRRLDGLLQGDYRSLFYGYGVDFADLREYQPEDDIRYIDWNVTARMDTPYVRQYIEDREITAWFLLDLSASMDFGAAQNLKQMVLVDFVATFARLLTRHGNRVGALMYTGQSPATHPPTRRPTERGIDLVVPAKGGRIHVLRLVNDLLLRTEAQKSARPASTTQLASLLESGLHTLKKRSLVFIVSDFFSAPGWERPLRQLNQRHEVLAVRVLDSRELELPDIGPIIVEDAESGEQVYVDTHDRGFRSRFQEVVRQHEGALKTIFNHAGVDLLTISTEDDMVGSIMRFASVRKQRQRGRGAGRHPAAMTGPAASGIFTRTPERGK